MSNDFATQLDTKLKLARAKKEAQDKQTLERLIRDWLPVIQKEMLRISETGGCAVRLNRVEKPILGFMGWLGNTETMTSDEVLLIGTYMAETYPSCRFAGFNILIWV